MRTSIQRTSSAEVSCVLTYVCIWLRKLVCPCGKQGK